MVKSTLRTEFLLSVLAAHLAICLSWLKRYIHPSTGMERCTYVFQIHIQTRSRKAVDVAKLTGVLTKTGKLARFYVSK